jgi:hypothetical protein
VSFGTGSDTETLKLLADIRIVATDASGAVLAENTGAATLGNPLNAVVWLVEDLAKAGRKLSAGDLISVGSFTPLTPPKAGQAISVRYGGCLARRRCRSPASRGLANPLSPESARPTQASRSSSAEHATIPAKLVPATDSMARTSSRDSMAPRSSF